MVVSFYDESALFKSRCGVAGWSMNRCTHRSVSFVDRVELEFQGNHFGQALSLGDVDGDGVSYAYTTV